MANIVSLYSQVASARVLLNTVVRSGELRGGKGRPVTNLIGPSECDSPISFKVLPSLTKRYPWPLCQMDT